MPSKLSSSPPPRQTRARRKAPHYIRPTELPAPVVSERSVRGKRKARR